MLCFTTTTSLVPFPPLKTNLQNENRKVEEKEESDGTYEKPFWPPNGQGALLIK